MQGANNALHLLGNETTDLLKDSETYQHRFQVVKDKIEQNRTQYENHTDVLDQAVQDIESEESANIVAPDAQYHDDLDKESVQISVSYMDVYICITAVHRF